MERGPVFQARSLDFPVNTELLLGASKVGTLVTVSPHLHHKMLSEAKA